jgi:hypothetical protein
MSSCAADAFFLEMAELFEQMLELTPTTLPGFRASPLVPIR